MMNNESYFSNGFSSFTREEVVNVLNRWVEKFDIKDAHKRGWAMTRIADTGLDLDDTLNLLDLGDPEITEAYQASAAQVVGDPDFPLVPEGNGVCEYEFFSLVEHFDPRVYADELIESLDERYDHLTEQVQS